MKHIVFFSAFLILVSCRKQKVKITELPKATNASELIATEPGSYWIYEKFDIKNGSETATGETDSVWQISDTTMNGHRFRQYRSNGIFPYLNIADSGTFLLDESMSVIACTETGRRFIRRYLRDSAGVYDHKTTDRISKGGQSIVTPFRTFQNATTCTDSTEMRLRGDGNTYRTSLEISFAPQTGCIQYELQYLSGVPIGFKSRYKLLRCHIKQ